MENPKTTFSLLPPSGPVKTDYGRARDILLDENVQNFTEVTDLLTKAELGRLLFEIRRELPKRSAIMLRRYLTQREQEQMILSPALWVNRGDILDAYFNLNWTPSKFFTENLAKVQKVMEVHPECLPNIVLAEFLSGLIHFSNRLDLDIEFAGLGRVELPSSDDDDE